MKSQLQQVWQELLNAPIESIKRSCLTWPDGSERILALEVLAQRHDISQSDALATLLDSRLLQHKDEHVRWVVVSALGKRWPELTLEPLVSALEDPSWLVRQHALQAIGIAVKRLKVLGQGCGSIQALHDTVLPQLLFLMRHSLKEVRTQVEGVLVGLIGQYGMALVDTLDTLLPTARSFQKASLLRSLARGLLNRVRGKEDVAFHTFGRLALLLQEASVSPQVTVRRACANGLCDALALQHAVKVPQFPYAFEEMWHRLVCDPHQSVRDAALSPGAMPLILSFGKRLVAGRGRVFTEESLVEIFKAVAAFPWAQEGQAAHRHLWLEVALHFVSHPSFTVRRCARSLLDALGPLVIGALAQHLREELVLLEQDLLAHQALHRLWEGEANHTPKGAAPTPNWGLLRWLQVASLVGGWQCLQFLRETPWPPHYQKAVAHCWMAIAQRLFACRSLTVVLWKIPEKNQLDPTLGPLMAQLTHHPCPFVAKAAQIGL